MNQQMKHVALRGWVICLFAFICILSVSAQQIAVKTNVLSDLGAVPVVAVELTVGERNSIEFGLTGTVAEPWGGDLELSSASLQYRYWVSQRALSQLFVGLGGKVGSYMYGDGEYKYDSDMGVAEFIAGYAWPIARRWNVELYYGIGLLLQQYRMSINTLQKTSVEALAAQTNLKFNLATTSLGMNIVYILK